MKEIVFKVTGWASLLILLVLTVVPAEERPITGLQHDLEHFVAFSSAGVILGLAYAGSFRRLYPGALTYALLLELSQLACAGRHARVRDFIVDALAAIAGLAVAQLLRTSKRRIFSSLELKKVMPLRDAQSVPHPHHPE